MALLTVKNGYLFKKNLSCDIFREIVLRVMILEYLCSKTVSAISLQIRAEFFGAPCRTRDSSKLLCVQGAVACRGFFLLNRMLSAVVTSK